MPDATWEALDAAAKALAMDEELQIVFYRHSTNVNRVA